MDQKVKAHIQKLQRRAILSLIAALVAILTITVRIGLLFATPGYAPALLIPAGICIVYLVWSHRVAQKETADGPVILRGEKALSFEETAAIFERLAEREAPISTAENVRFYRIHKILRLRIVLYGTDAFDKEAFDNAKSRINKKANRELHISPWVRGSDTVKMMRLNIIHTQVCDAPLQRFLEQDADHGLRRVEGVMSLAMVGDQVLMPPLYGDCDWREISRYKKVIRFVHEMLLHPQ